MANTYGKIYLHYVTAVKFRDRLILPIFEDELYGVIGNSLKENGQLPIRINGMPDHIHVLFALKPSAAPTDIIAKFKARSSGWINKSGYLGHRFEWQRGGGIFSVDYHNVDRVINYINRQKIHHGTEQFKEEYLKLLGDYKIAYKEEYLLNFFD